MREGIPAVAGFVPLITCEIVRTIALVGVFLAASLCRAADTIAVLPLFNLNQSQSPDLDWIGESVAETIHESLSSVGLLALAREDREEVYHRLSLRTGVVLTRASVVKIGQTLDAGQIVFGEFQVEGADLPVTSPKSNLRLVVRIIDLKKLRQGPEFLETGPLENLSQMETRLGWTLAHQFAPEGTPTQDEFFRSRPPVRVDAMESYIRGLAASNPDQKLKLFQQAARVDEHFSQPAFQLGRIFFQKKDYKTSDQWLVQSLNVRFAFSGSGISARHLPVLRRRFRQRDQSIPAGGRRDSPQRGL